MKMLQRTEREQIGFSFVLEQLEPMTPYGKDCLKNLTPFDRKDGEELRREFAIQEEIINHREEVLPIQKKMELLYMGLKEVRGSIKKSETGILTEVDFFELKNCCLVLEKLQPLMEEYIDITGIREWTLHPVEGLLKLLDPEGERIPSFYISSVYMPELEDIREEKRQIEAKIRCFQNNESPEVEEALRQRDEIVEKEEACNRRILEMLTFKFQGYRQELEENLAIIGHSDLVWQKVNFAQAYQCSKPVIDAQHFLIKNMIHPEISTLLAGKGGKFTPLSVEIRPGVCVITGANMGGKSVAIKTAALMTYMAYCGFFVPAEKCELPDYEEIYLIMDEYEETFRGLSSFGGEIIRLRDCLNEMGDRRCLVLMDEPARGTNPEEGAKIVQALVRYLKTTNSDTFLTTHYEHIGELADTHYQVYGLKRYSDEELQKAVNGLTNKDRVSVLSKYMDYGVYPVSGAQPLPQDAIRVCRLLGLQEEILQDLERGSL